MIVGNLLPIIFSALIGSGLTYWFGIRQLRTETEIKFKVEKYNNLIKYLRGFVGTGASGELKKQFFQEWETSWLYCSDEVFDAVRRMIEFARAKGKSNAQTGATDEKGREILGEIIIAMRKDLLRKKTHLSSKDFLFWDVYE